MKSLTKPLNGKTLKLITKKFSKEWKQKLKIQCDVPTAHDHIIKEGLTLINTNMESIPWNETLDKILLKMEDFASREIVESFVSHMVNWHYGRFVDYDNRKTSTVKNQGTINLEFLNRSDKERNFSMSQGRFSCLKWKDTIVFKTVYDLAIYQMLLWELKPKTILEIGSGNGGSAIWMSDLITIYKIYCKILSIDIHPPPILSIKISLFSKEIVISLNQC